MDLDRTLMGGLVVDGTGARAYRADVGIRRGRIEAIGDLAAAPSGERVDARGRVVCPGFIDMHSHSDLSLLLCPTGDSKIQQGVTTEVIGNCGFSPAPLTAEHAETVRSLQLGLASKGRVQVGADADLVVFDPATVRDVATYADPHRFPAGIEHVLVAGDVTIRDGRHTGARSGRVLRRP